MWLVRREVPTDQQINSFDIIMFQMQSFAYGMPACSVGFRYTQLDLRLLSGGSP
jgi:hypothetical protein